MKIKFLALFFTTIPFSTLYSATQTVYCKDQTSANAIAEAQNNGDWNKVLALYNSACHYQQDSNECPYTYQCQGAGSWDYSCDYIYNCPSVTLQKPVTDIKTPLKK